MEQREFGGPFGGREGTEFLVFPPPLTLTFFVLGPKLNSLSFFYYHNNNNNYTAEPSLKTLETMRKFSEQFAKR